jgi:hypothetical protein
MDDLALGDLGVDTGLHRALKNPAKSSITPALTDACQGRVIGKCFMQTVADELSIGAQN